MQPRIPLEACEQRRELRGAIVQFLHRLMELHRSGSGGHKHDPLVGSRVAWGRDRVNDGALKRLEIPSSKKTGAARCDRSNSGVLCCHSRPQTIALH